MKYFLQEAEKELSKLLLICLILFAGGAMAADKPTIVVIWGDDTGMTNVSAYGQGVVGYKTPNIDRIAKVRCVVHRLLHRE
jgi:hypothetical protein